MNGFFDGKQGLSMSYLDSDEAKIISKYWSKNCNDRLRELTKIFGKHYIWFINKEFQYLVGLQQYENFRREIEKLEAELKGKSWVHAYSNIPMYYAEAICQKERLPVRQFPFQECEICRKKGSKSELLPRYLNYVPQFFYSNLYFCNACLDKAFLSYNNPKEEKNEKALREDLLDLLAVLGELPARSMMRNSEFYRKLSVDKLQKTIPILVKMNSIEVYERKLGSWQTLRTMLSKDELRRD